MEYTIKRKGKTYDEYRQIILEQVQARNLEAGDEAALLAKLYQDNDEWFEEHQKLHDLEQRIKDLQDLSLAIQFSGATQKNPALVVKQILEGDEDLLSSLESVKDQVIEFYAKEQDKKNARQNHKARKSEMVEFVKGLDLNSLKADDRNKFVKYLMQQILEENIYEQDND